MDEATREFLEPRFGHDFSRVSVYADTPALDLIAPRADSIGASRLKLESQLSDKADDTQGDQVAAAEDPALEEDAADEGIVFETVDSDSPAPIGPTKTKCPVPAAAATGFPIAKSTAAQIAGMSKCQSGTTKPDPLIVETSTCDDAGVWRLRVGKVKSVIRTFSRMFAGRAEPTTGNSTKTNFCDQVRELDAFGFCGPWYMLAAIKAHENVHVSEWKTNFGTDWPAQKAIIEGLSVPATGATKGSKAATSSMRSSAAFKGALKTNRANYPTFWGIADPNADTNSAERAIVDPRIETLCNHAKKTGWSPSGCKVCADKGITD